MCTRKSIVRMMMCGLLFLAAGCCNPFCSKKPKPVDLLLYGMVGWEVVGGPADSWQFADGVLYTEGNVETGNWISTTQQYSDFLLELQFNISEGGNSGVFVRAPRNGDSAYEGIEIQILDDHAQRAQELQPWQYTGAVYDVKAPSERVTKKADQGQTMAIHCKYNTLTVQINGNIVIDNLNLDEAQSKSGRPHPGLTRSEGYIGFQNHKSPVKFRNVYITDLSMQL